MGRSALARGQDQGPVEEGEGEKEEEEEGEEMVQLVWFSSRVGFNPGFLIRSSALVVVVGRLRLGIPLLLTLRRFLLALPILMFLFFFADVIKSFDSVDRGILDSVLSGLGLPGWFRHAYFEYHAHVRLRAVSSQRLVTKT